MSLGWPPSHFLRREAGEGLIGHRHDTVVVVTDLGKAEEVVVVAMAVAKGSSLTATEMLQVKAALAGAAGADIVVADLIDLITGVGFPNPVNQVHLLS